MRILFLTLLSLPFLFWVVVDNYYHVTLRKVPLAENIIHLVLGIALVCIFIDVYSRAGSLRISWLCCFLVAGSIDEFVFHRNLPLQETQAHAKEHWALLLFLLGSQLIVWLGV